MHHVYEPVIHRISNVIRLDSGADPELKKGGEIVRLTTSVFDTLHLLGQCPNDL